MQLNRFGLVSLSIIMLAGCQTTQKAAPPATPVIGGMPNPASAFCEERHGKLEFRSSSDGVTGYCHLPDGRVVAEWTYFRESSPAAKGH